ncbi:MAG: 6-hydroxymethylpterin diphosphokinase MptE-like protein [Promethearchaeota archaeon]
MNWSEWQKSYYQIIEQLDFDIEADKKARNLLEKYFIKLNPITKYQIFEKLKTTLLEPIIIAGAGPSLKRDFSNLFLGFYKNKILTKFRTIAVDGATALFKQNKIIPSIVVTDLDGDLTAIRWAIEKGALTLIHAHGDNQQQLSLFIDKYNEIIVNNNVWGTTQCKPRHILFNFGGFTDGDRAIFLAFHFQSPLICLIGFDFGTQIGEYSTLNSPIKKERKKKLEKFQIALNLLSNFQSQHRGLRYNMTYQGEEISGFLKLSISDFLQNLI